MPVIPRQVKPPARIALTCKVPEHVAALLKHYAEFLDSTQEYIVAETLQLTFRKDREFQAWLATTHPDVRLAPPEGTTSSANQSDRRDTSAAGPNRVSVRRSGTNADRTAPHIANQPAG